MTETIDPAPARPPTPEDGARPELRRPLAYGAMTMVALMAANGLQQGNGSSFSQALEGIKKTFGVHDWALGAVSTTMGLTGAVGALLISRFAARHPRTKVLAWMFAVWSGLMLLCGLTKYLSAAPLALGFTAFFLIRIPISVTEATDPAALPLLADYYPVRQRAGKSSLFNLGAAVCATAAIAGGGVLIDNFGWQWAFYMWVPVGLAAAWLMARQPEPVRGAQDAAYRDELASLSSEAAALEEEDEDLVASLVADAGIDVDLSSLPGLADPRSLSKMELLRTVFRLRTWRITVIAIGVAQIMQSAVSVWGLSYFKRTFHLDSAQAGVFALVLGVPVFVGLVGGGFVADRMLRRGMIRIRVYVCGICYILGGVLYCVALSSTQLWIAAPTMALAAMFAGLPTGPQFALLLDVTPASLRPQAAAITNIVQSFNAFGYVLVGLLSSLYGENLRLALLTLAPVYIVGGAMLLHGRKTYVQDVAMVVAEARQGLAGEAT